MLSDKLSACAEQIELLRSLAIQSLAKMYLPEERLFVFRLRQEGASVIPEGISSRYTAIALIGLAGESDDVITSVLGQDSVMDVCDRLVAGVDGLHDIGAIALIAWAAKANKHPGVNKAMQALREMTPGKKSTRTVELAWALMAEVVGDEIELSQAKETAASLLTAYNPKSKLFQYRSRLNGRFGLHNHACCFADLVYPIMALSTYYKATGNAEAAEVACDCAERMCQLQGAEGQWWWYFDNRTGEILERFPVYATHQDSMAPMALLALADAMGQEHYDSIRLGLQWLFHANEIKGSLIDTDRSLIWRKVGRRGIDRIFVSGLQAAASRFHPALRTPLLNVLFPGNTVEYETRPYHMGWILHAWPAEI
jgi:hypothetical protein